MRTIPAALALLLLLSACGSDDAGDDPVATVTKDDGAGDLDGSSDDPEPTEDPEPEETTEASPEPEPTPQPTAEPTPTPEPTPTGPPTEGLPGGRYVQIDAVRAEGQSYAVDFTPYNFDPLIGSGPGDFHIHFFWDTIEPANAGTNGPNPGSWELYDGPSPFSGYSFGSRPPEATMLCALVADSAHGVTVESGNCVTLP